jgi:predicted nucleotidyltransferase component of viral defense system
MRILEILDKFLDELRRSNPYGFVLKGGTALALHHLNKHRESEDLDFDVDQQYFGEIDSIIQHLIHILDSLVKEGSLKDYTVRKKGFSSTNRFHMNLSYVTHKTFFSKIDIDFIELPDNLDHEGELLFYSSERLFVGKLLAFLSRKELKDIYDIAHLLKTIKPSSFTKPKKVAVLINDAITILEREGTARSYQRTLTDIDLRFHSLKERNVHAFIEKTLRNLRMFGNELRKLS